MKLKIFEKLCKNVRIYIKSSKSDSYFITFTENPYKKKLNV